MFLKKLFLASASVLMLALAYHLGASTAGAQSGTTIAAGLPFYCGGTCIAAVVGRTLYGSGSNGLSTAAPIPGTAPVVAIGTVTHGALAVMLSNGDAYVVNNTGTGWNSIGNPIPGGSTLEARTTWGSVKVQQR